MRRGRDQGGIHLSGHEIHETPAASTLLPGERSSVGLAGSAVSVAMVIKAQPTHHDDEPEGERPRPRTGIATKPATPVLPQVIQHEGVAIHQDVVVASERTHDPKDLAGVSVEKGGPRILSRQLGGRVEDRGQFGGCHRGHAGSLGGHSQDLVRNVGTRFAAGNQLKGVRLELAHLNMRLGPRAR